MPDAEGHLQEHFENLARQTHAARLGMWIFLGSEVLFFGALFALYGSYRVAYPADFAEASRHTDLLLGSLNTFVLLTASLLVALSVGMARSDRRRSIAPLLAGAFLLGLLFLALKALEYEEHFAEGLYPGRYFHSAALHGAGAQAFFTLYYVMTGLHFLHVAIGVLLLGGLARAARADAFGSAYHTPLEVGGMYWHFVDVVWLFLWPIFYLIH